jgi:hypothetical protein
MDLSAFDSAIGILERSVSNREALLDWLTVALIIFDLVVVSGLIIEFHEEAIEFVTGRPRTRRGWKLAFLGGVAVVLGIVGELSITFIAHRVETHIRSDSHKIEGLLNTKAGSAADAADRASKSAQQAEGYASNALALARGARQEADIFERRLASAEHKADEAESHLAKVSQDAAEAYRLAQQERLAYMQLANRLAERTLKPEQQERIRRKLSGVSGIEIDVVIWGDTPDIETISGLILNSLPRTGWKIGVAHAAGGGAVVRGILVGARKGSDSNILKAADLLISSLRSEGLGVAPWTFEELQFPSLMMNSSLSGKAPIRMFIGAKP